jgi:hypothetical protein
MIDSGLFIDSELEGPSQPLLQIASPAHNRQIGSITRAARTSINFHRRAFAVFGAANAGAFFA